MKYALYLFLICVVINLLYACKKKSHLPAQFEEGEILFRTVQTSAAKRDTHFTLLVIKKNKVKTVYLHQRPHFATIRILNSPVVNHIHLENNTRKAFAVKDTLYKKKLIFNTLIKLSDTLFWNRPVSRHQYNAGDTTFTFSVIKNMDISPLYMQDLDILQGFVSDKFAAHIKVKTSQTEIVSQIIRLEQKDIADIEFE